MTFSVVWTVAASRDFAAMLSVTDDPAVIQAAAADVDRYLRRLAPDLGESRGSGYRLWFCGPLEVFYSIDEEAMRVEVIAAGPSSHR